MSRGPAGREASSTAVLTPKIEVAIGVRRPSSFLSYLTAAVEWSGIRRHEASEADIIRMLAGSGKPPRAYASGCCGVSLRDAEVSGARPGR